MAVNTTLASQNTGRIFLSRRVPRQRFLLTTFAVIASIIFLWPFFVLVANSFNSIDVYMNPLVPWPKEFTLRAYQLAFGEKYSFQNYVLNTVLVVTATAALGTFVASLAGYALAKLQFPGRNILFAIIMAVMLLPTETMLVPQFVVVRDLGMVNTFWGIILPGVAGSAFGIFLMRQFMLQIPTEMLEAGRIDGCTEFGLFTRIVVPIMKGPILVLATLSVRTVWNALLWPQIVLSEETKQLLMPAIVRVRSLTVADPYALLIATAVAILGGLVPLVFYMYSQRFFVSALAGAIKG
ncbi:MAG: carbohydrate ABC transporter permease [Anaerolineae bacterium]|nr:carbohydrate ABC transporter permease [Anaerolineae bacterium]